MRMRKLPEKAFYKKEKTMKQTKEFIVFRSKKTGSFLMSYKNKKTALAYEATWSEDVEDALNVPEEFFEKERNIYEALLKSFNAEPLRVKAEYTLTTREGEEPEEIEVDSKTKCEGLADALLDALFGSD